MANDAASIQSKLDSADRRLGPAAVNAIGQHWQMPQQIQHANLKIDQRMFYRKPSTLRALQIVSIATVNEVRRIDQLNCRHCFVEQILVRIRVVGHQIQQLNQIQPSIKPIQIFGGASKAPLKFGFS